MPNAPTTSLPSFSPPGPGEWRIIDHIANPGTRFFAEYYYEPMEAGWNEEAEAIGTINRVKIREVNGFMYYQMEGIEEQQLQRMCQVNKGYWDEKRFLTRLQYWDQVVRPAAYQQLMQLQKTRLNCLSKDELIAHIDRCFAVTKEMVRFHHSFTYTAFIPTGDFIRRVSGWTEKNPSAILFALKGSSSSKRFRAHESDVVKRLIAELRRSTVALYWLSKVERANENVNEILNQLFNQNDSIVRGLDYILENFGYHLVNGYDIATETFMERPDILLRSIKSLLTINAAEDENEMQDLRALVPTAEKPQFDEMLKEAREMQRLREERGIYSDLWAIGILRHAVQEAGKRLAQQGRIDSEDLALDATPEELKELLRGQETVQSQDLQLRADYRTSFSVTDAPAILGLASTQRNDPEPLPPDLTRTMAGLNTAIVLAVDHVKHEAQQKNMLVGTPASRGVIDGRVRVILSQHQFQEVKRGEILVVYQTTASFSVIFPIIAGVISQFGGILSHPAILAREYGIPCVVGCSGATEYLRTGMRIRLDGNNGTVTILEDKQDFVEQLSSLQCEYTGPMQGRNRNRVFNHLGSVSEKIRLLEKIRCNQQSLEVLQKYWQAEISTEEAVKEIIFQLGKVSVNITRADLESIPRRYHIEFHPCDACNLRCSGCTYFQDTPSRPEALSFPYEKVAKIFSFFQPRAITLVGGGEPTLYKSGPYKLGDLICSIGEGTFGRTPTMGLISNGVQWPAGNPKWHRHINWVRYSLDASNPESYFSSKGKHYFETVLDTIFHTLIETSIPKVGVGFLYHTGNIDEAGRLISVLAQRVRSHCPDQVHRLNVQFRPWRMPVGRPSITERILSNEDIERSSLLLLKEIEADPYIEKFTRQNTNIAVNLLCGGAREHVQPFSECYFGLAKTVVRAEGSLYPCFRMAATRDPEFCCGNILHEDPLDIALKEIYISLFSVQKACVPEYDKCLFCVFNNALEVGLIKTPQTQPELLGDYFF